MQSRYYNPEWGRFINSDGVAGQTGELLGHNMFAYCKNNAVNMHDNDGERPDFGDGTGRETNDERELSLACMSSVNMNRYVNKQKIETVKSIASIALGTGASAADTVASYKVFNNLQKVKNVIVGCKEFAPGLQMEGAISRGWVAPVKFVGSKLGAFSIAVTGYSLYGDYQNNNGWDIGKSMAVDGVGFLASVGVGALIGVAGLTLAPAIAVMAGSALLIGGLGYLAKKQLGVN